MTPAMPTTLARIVGFEESARDALRALAASDLRGGRPREALEIAQALTSLDPLDAPAWELHGRALDALGDHRLAETSRRIAGRIRERATSASRKE